MSKIKKQSEKVEVAKYHWEKNITVPKSVKTMVSLMKTRDAGIIFKHSMLDAYSASEVSKKMNKGNQNEKSS